MDNQIDTSAEKGFQDALAYDAYRPSYPPPTVDKLLSLLPSDAHRPLKVVDLAAGTGKFTELLAAQVDKIKAVEPHRQMREVLYRKSFEKVEVLDGTAAEMDRVPSNWAHAMAVAQAFHWFANANTLREAHRVLVPYGVLFLLWNEEDYNSQTDYQPVTKWEIEMRKIAWELDDKQRKFHNASWQDVFNQDEDALFDLPLQSETITWTVWLTRQGLWDRFRTLSFIATLGNDEQKEVQEKLFSIIERNDLDTETNIEGEIAVHGRTHMVWTFRRPTRS